MKHLTRYAAIGALSVLALGGCRAPAPGNDAATMELKIYDVPAAQTAKLAEALGNALGKSASVTMPSPGKLLVYAPEPAQHSIVKALGTLTKSASAEGAPIQLDVRFWVIDGEPGAGDNDPELKPLASSLAPLRQNMGPLHFRLNQLASLTGTSNEPSSLTTADNPYERKFQFRITATEGDTARLHLSYADNGGHGLGTLDTNIDATFGQYIVLAQAPGGCPKNFGIPTLIGGTASPCPDKPALRLLVVRVNRLPAKA